VREKKGVSPFPKAPFFMMPGKKSFGPPAMRLSSFAVLFLPKIMRSIRPSDGKGWAVPVMTNPGCLPGTRLEGKRTKGLAGHLLI